MATQRGGKKLPAKASVPSSDYYIPPVPVVVAPVRQSVKEDIVAAILLCLSLALLLPLGAMLYLDVLQTNQEVKQELIKLQKLRRQIEQKEKDK
jgi:hypothetical protein